MTPSGLQACCTRGTPSPRPKSFTPTIQCARRLVAPTARLLATARHRTLAQHTPDMPTSVPHCRASCSSKERANGRGHKSARQRAFWRKVSASWRKSTLRRRPKEIGTPIMSSMDSTPSTSSACPPARSGRSEPPTPCRGRYRAMVHVVRQQRVCTCGAALHVEARVSGDRFLSNTNHTAHWGRTEASRSAGNAQSEQSAAGQVCNTPE